MTTKFFEGNSYFIDEKVNFLKFENAYQVFNDKGGNIGSIRQKLSFGQKILRLLLNKSMLPFRLEIKDNNEMLQASINRGWTFFMSKITVEDANNQAIGYIVQKFKFVKPNFKIYNLSDQLIAEINGDWKAWDFTIKNASGTQIGSISKKWAGAMQELFTTADKYYVNISNTINNDTAKVIIISSAITIDMVLKERK